MVAAFYIGGIYIIINDMAKDTIHKEDKID